MLSRYVVYRVESWIAVCNLKYNVGSARSKSHAQTPTVEADYSSKTSLQRRLLNSTANQVSNFCQGHCFVFKTYLRQGRPTVLSAKSPSWRPAVVEPATQADHASQMMQVADPTHSILVCLLISICQRLFPRFCHVWTSVPLTHQTRSNQFRPNMDLSSSCAACQRRNEPSNEG